MAITKTVMYLVLTAMVAKLATGTNYTVGGPSGGWDITTDQRTWASSKTFHVGDNLIFQYSPMHDVAEVTKSDYDSCQATAPIQSYSSGSTAIPLMSPGKRYFVCTTTGHCNAGMKLEVVTLATASSPEVPPPEAAAAPAPVFEPVSSPAPEAFAPSPVLPPEAPEAFVPSPMPPPESPEEVSLPSPPESSINTPSAVPDIPSTESPAAAVTPLTRTSADIPDSSAKKGPFLTGLSFVIIMIPTILAF